MQPILITTAINPPQNLINLKLNNSFKRLILTKAAIYFWIVNTSFPIVVADATGYEIFSASELEEFKKLGATVEQISYHQNTEDVLKKGKGFAEGFLIAYALENSKILNDYDHFYKCTGKIYCKNFNDISIIIDTNKIDSIFWKWLEDGWKYEGWVDMRFFYCSKKLFYENVLNVFKNADDFNQRGPEEDFFKVVGSILNKGSTTRPQLTGYSGGWGQSYFDKSLGALDFNFPCFFRKTQ